MVNASAHLWSILGLIIVANRYARHLKQHFINVHSLVNFSIESLQYLASVKINGSLSL